MKKYTYQELEFEFSKHKYNWSCFHIIGIRSKSDKPDAFDDLIILIDGDKISYYTGTTNPGTHWLKNFLNPKGTAVLKPDQYIDGWKIGLHKGYEALVQNKPVTVYRDTDKDDKSEEQGKEDTGFFGINIHRTGAIISKIIGRWSAGCQVLNNPEEFKDFMRKIKFSGKKTFTFTLLKEF
ncbi:MAG TPA: hypothetical protein VMV86_02455 [Methanosarcinales archaeon]|nr:hypothetical protein [Methanosarcinales archaeon]